MKKDGSGVGQRIYPVEYSSMTGNFGIGGIELLAGILIPALALIL